ncbi:peroxisomal membrane protein 4 isoform X1 [Heterocephalus glaber]|uniref:Peroxisomal membrane protein 4 n=1 Tax=Heterocephalus glaber TaxID=10181 RepID=A0A0P6J8A8_HETGA|nr:peroxisomal membrane protein 4 isoform X1 [Heterocephalus glaber]
MAASSQLKALLQAVNTLLRKRRYHAALAVLKGFRNGAVYGAKIRAPHALVMTFLFRSGSLREKLWAILQATYTHSWNLARFVFTYKGLCALQAHMQGQTHQAHSFLAACLGGMLVFGEKNNINSQISMYLTSRILFALCRLGVEKGYIPEPRWDPFPLHTGVVWGIVLWLFEYHRHTLQPSLQSSMTYLYEDSNTWHDITDFLIYNKSSSSK